MKLGLRRNIYFQLGSFAISFFFALLIVGLYFLFHFYAGPGWNLASNWISVLVSALALVFFIPFREFLNRRWEAYILRRDLELETNLGYLLKLLARPASFDDLIQSIFPRILGRFDIENGLFGILDEEGGRYTLYYLSAGKVKRVPRVFINSGDEYIDTLANSLIATGKIAGPLNIQGIRNRMLRQNSEFYVSLPYRGKLIGFWALPNKIEGKENIDLIKLFAVKAALVIYNNKLRPSIAKGKEIGQEFLVAEKIQSFLKRTPLPRSREFDLEYKFSRAGYIEFLRPFEFIYIRNLQTFPSGIVLSTAIGLIHACRELDIDDPVEYIHNQLKNDFGTVEEIACMGGKLKLRGEREEGAIELNVKAFGPALSVDLDGQSVELPAHLQAYTLAADRHAAVICRRKPFLRIKKRVSK